MTGTVYTVVYTQIIPVIFEPPCIKNRCSKIDGVVRHWLGYSSLLKYEDKFFLGELSSA